MFLRFLYAFLFVFSSSKLRRCYFENLLELWAEVPMGEAEVQTARTRDRGPRVLSWNIAGMEWNVLLVVTTD